MINILFLWLSSWLRRITEKQLCILSLLSKGAPQLHILINILVHFRETLGLFGFKSTSLASDCIHSMVWELCSHSLGKSANDKEHFMKTFFLSNKNFDFNPRQIAIYFSHSRLQKAPFLQHNKFTFAGFGEVTMTTVRSHSSKTSWVKPQTYHCRHHYTTEHILSWFSIMWHMGQSGSLWIWDLVQVLTKHCFALTQLQVGFSEFGF